MLKLADFKNRLRAEEALVNDTVSKVRGGQKENVTTYEVSFDKHTGEACDSGTSSDPVTWSIATANN